MPLAGPYHTDQLHLLRMPRSHHSQVQCSPKHMRVAPIPCLTCASQAPGVPDEEWRTRHLMLPVLDRDVVSRPAGGGLGAHHIPAICKHSEHWSFPHSLQPDGGCTEQPFAHQKQHCT